ncbi:MAG TPA: hypothetical protein VM736_05200, partial [Gemmatimonadales bacterium]|nr:hypothetical protein [Gemmatimonadales bacterium]
MSDPPETPPSALAVPQPSPSRHAESASDSARGPRGSGRLGADTLVTAILGSGVVLRLLEYLARRSLWTDETWMALDIGTKTFTGRHAPFLALEWVVTRVGGVNELALRAVPLAAGIALLLLVPRFAARFLDTTPAVAFATAVAAASPALFYFSNEAKAYGLDPLLAVLLTGGAFHVLDTLSSRRAWVRLLGLGAVALAFSIPAVFVLAGIALALAMAPQVRRQPGARRWLAIASAVGVVAFLAVYRLLYRASATDMPMRRWWEGGFLTPGAPDFFRRSWVAASTAVGEHFVGGQPEPVVVVLAALLVVAGLAVIARRRGPTACLLVLGPIAFALAASVVQIYPIAPRTLLFALPHIIVALSAGVTWLVDRLPLRARSVSLALAGVLWCAPGFAADVDRIVYPRLPEAPRLAV